MPRESQICVKLWLFRLNTLKLFGYCDNIFLTFSVGIYRESEYVLISLLGSSTKERSTLFKSHTSRQVTVPDLTVLGPQSLGTDVWCACLIFCLPSHSCIYHKTSYPTLRCACGGRAERRRMVYANDNTRLIYQIKFWCNRYPWAHPLWLVEWSSTWWPMHLWPGLPK